METFICTTETDLAEVATAVLASATALTKTQAGAVVVTLAGDLGAGKTALTKTIAHQLGVSETVSSPTFVIARQYDTSNETFSTLIHIDAYRIESLAELIPLHFAELLATPNTLCCIEWASQIAEALPSVGVAVTIEADETETRRITLERYG